MAFKKKRLGLLDHAFLGSLAPRLPIPFPVVAVSTIPLMVPSVSKRHIKRQAIAIMLLWLRRGATKNFADVRVPRYSTVFGSWIFGICHGFLHSWRRLLHAPMWWVRCAKCLCHASSSRPAQRHGWTKTVHRSFSERPALNVNVLDAVSASCE